MAGQRSRRRIPEATVARLPVYLQLLSTQFDEGVANISSEELAELAGVNAAKVRKDLSYLGSYGTRGVGYEVEFLVYQIKRELGLTHDWPVVIVGAGNLGQALAGYGGFGERGFPVGGIVDIDPDKLGTVVGGARVRHLDDLEQIVRSRSLSIGVIATPGAAAQA
ncbi:MAG: redox-sensing transcriptional repressor Rex, partial [Actinomycetota bacterium]